MPDLSMRAREMTGVRMWHEPMSGPSAQLQLRSTPAAARVQRDTAPTGEPPVEGTEDGPAAADGSFGVEGYACVTDEPYEMQDWLGPYIEVVRSGAFAATLGNKADVRLLINHGGIPLARTKSGTLDLDEDDTGLHSVAPELDAASSLAQDVRSALERGDLDEMSFMFRIVKQQWSPDYMQLDILEVQLFDVSIVTFPANPATSVGLRGIDFARVPEAEARAALEQLNRRFAPATASTPRRALRERILQTL